MLDLAKKAILTGLGLGLVAKDKIDEAVQKIREENKLTEEESRKLAKELLDESEEARQKLTDLVKKTTNDICVNLDLPSRQEYTKLEKRITKLEKSTQKTTNDSA